MSTRRTFLTGLGGVLLAGGGYAAGAFREARAQADTRLFGQSVLIQTDAGALEFATAGEGPPLLMLHGAGGGFDQGLLLSGGIRERGFRVIAPSRFGYLRSAFPDDASPAHQADVLAALLDHLDIDQLPVVGGSAGALPAAEFARRHPDRCSHLVLLVPAANLSGRDPVEFTAFQQRMVGAVLGSDWWFWLLSRMAPGQLTRALLATDPALLGQVSDRERRRAEITLDQLFPIGRKIAGLRNDGFWSGTPANTEFAQIRVPTLILSCDDDLFGTADTARILADRIPGARLTIYPTGGHLWLGHDGDVGDAVSALVRNPAPDVAQ
jgi:pimeloyl-ACP methyl ester carboxylesterase